MVDVDISDLLMHARINERLHRAVPNRLKSILDHAAEEEQSNHTYQNRTGDLQASTQAIEVGRSNDSVTVDLVMAEEYASYVVARGFSTIEEQEARAEQALASEIGAIMSAMGR